MAGRRTACGVPPVERRMAMLWFDADMRPWCVGTLLAAVLAGGPVTAVAQGVKVALLPATQTVAPGAEFDLSMEVTVAGSAFNGFDAYIGYDPAALTLIPLSPISLQE